MRSSLVLCSVPTFEFPMRRESKEYVFDYILFYFIMHSLYPCLASSMVLSLFFSPHQSFPGACFTCFHQCDSIWGTRRHGKKTKHKEKRMKIPCGCTTLVWVSYVRCERLLEQALLFTAFIYFTLISFSVFYCRLCSHFDRLSVVNFSNSFNGHRNTNFFLFLSFYAQIGSNIHLFHMTLYFFFVLFVLIHFVWLLRQTRGLW